MNAIVKTDDAINVPEPQSLLQLIARAAADPSIDIDKMDRLLQMQERIAARDAETQFNIAMNQAQSEMRPIAADAENPQTKSRYASYSALDTALRPIYIKHGFSISYDEGESKKPEHVLVLAYVSRGAHTRTYRTDMPTDGKGAKGGDVMTKTHAAGAAKSYGKRYLLKDIFNVAVGEEDRDGNGAEESIGPGQLASLEQLIDEVQADTRRLCLMLKIGSLSQIRVGAFDTVKAIIEAKRAK